MKHAFRFLSWAFVAAVAGAPVFIGIVMYQHGFRLDTVDLPDLPQIQRTAAVIPEWLFWTTCAALGLPCGLALISEWRNARRINNPTSKQ